jgi:PAS domain S-box-containing protein
VSQDACPRRRLLSGLVSGGGGAAALLLGWQVLARLPVPAAVGGLILLAGMVFLAGWRLSGRQGKRAPCHPTTHWSSEPDLIQVRLQALLDAATDVSIIATDPAGLIKVFNTGAEKLLGYRAEEVLGRYTPELIHLESEVRERGVELSAELGRPIEGFEVFVARARLGNAEQREWTYVRKDGQYRQVSLVVSAVFGPGGEVNGFLGIAQDVTEQHRAAEELRIAKEAADRANRAKTAFLASLSHEIRTPLNGVLGMTELLAQTDLRADQRDYLGSLTRAAEALLGLITDVLDVSKIEAGRLDLERIPFDVREIVRDATRVLEGQSRLKGLHLETRVADDVPPAVVGDPRRLRQVLLNLLSNAVKFTEKGKIVVEVNRESTDDTDHTEKTDQTDKNAEVRSASSSVLSVSSVDRIRFSVRDTGVGIPPKSRDSIFEPFMQAESSTSRMHGGTGLGLTIAARLVERMGGRLSLTSEVGQGSTFFFTIVLERAQISPVAAPVSAEASEGQPSVPAAVPGDARPGRRESLAVRRCAPRIRTGEGRPVRVLLAEDNPINQEVMSVWLTNQGHEVTVVPNGVEALMALEREQFDLVLMDIQMPQMDGVRASRLIRAREKNTGGRIPIVAVTANALQGEKQRCLAAGMDDYLPKPVRLEELKTVIARLTGFGGKGGVPAEGRDWIETLGQIGVDRTSTVKLARVFLETVPPRLEALRRAIADSDFEQVVSAAHALKNSLMVFHANQAVAAAAHLEALGRQKRSEGAEELLEDLDSALALVMTDLERYISSEKA